MITKKDECIVDIHNKATVNMSNWQITHTVDTLTMVNNKFDVLDKINELTMRGIDKKNIFITDKSFLISTNYKTYFEKSSILGDEGSSVIKAANIGKIITMEYNADIANINCLFEIYKKISSLLVKYHNCRLNSKVLNEAYNTLTYWTISETCMVLRDGAIQQVIEIYERYLEPDYKKRDSLIQKIEEIYKKEFQKILKKNEEIALKSRKKFEYFFERLDRPVVGVYHPDQRFFEIINADQMYKNGEESANRIKLCSITKNSPVLLTLAVTGVMLATIVYLAYRDHKVDDLDMIDNMGDVPQTSSEAIHNILSSKEGCLISSETEKNLIDPFIERLAIKNMEKLERVTDKSKVRIEVHNSVKVDI